MSEKVTKDIVSALKEWDAEEKNAIIELVVMAFQEKKNEFGKVRNFFAGENNLKMRLENLQAFVRQIRKEKVLGSGIGLSKGRNMTHNLMIETEEL